MFRADLLIIEYIHIYMGNESRNGLDAALWRLFGTPVVTSAVVWGAIEAEQEWDFLDKIDIPEEMQLPATAVAAVIGLWIGGIWGGKRQNAIYRAEDGR